MLYSAIAGAAGLALTAVGYFLSPEEALYSYLTAFAYWVGVPAAALILLACFHASKARWMVVLKRSLEWISLAVGAFLVLFIPVALGMDKLFPWVSHRNIPEEMLHHLHHKHAYLNVPGFLIRAAIYFIVWIGVSHLLHSWSARQDKQGDVTLTEKQRNFGTGSLPFLALAFTFAGFDWLMSLDPLWFSTIFGVYYFSGSLLAAIAIWTLTAVWARGSNLFGNWVTPAHLHNLGKLLLAFTAFWAYIAFSQYLLIWIGNLPEENVWYIARTQGSWKPVGIFLIIGHFLVPFFLLLSRAWKMRHGFLVGISLWILFVHAVDIYWLVLPSVRPQSPLPHWTLFTAFVGVGGLAIAYGLFRARGQYTLPIRDPYLADSLRYTQP
jgi:hypothetical protein